MKIKKIIFSIASVAVFALLATSCGKSNSSKPTTKSPTPVVTNSGSTTKTNPTTQNNNNNNYSKEEIEFNEGDTDTSSLITTALAAINRVYNDEKGVIPVSEKDLLDVCYNKATNLANKVSGNADEVKASLNGLYKALNDNIEILKQEASNLTQAKTLAVTKINLIKDELDAFINEYTMIYINMAVDALLEEVDGATSVEDIKTLLLEASATAKEYATTIISSELATAIGTRLSELDTVYEKLQSVASSNNLRILYVEILKLKAKLCESLTTDDLNKANAKIDKFECDLFMDYDNVVTVSLDKLKEYAISYLIVEKAKTIDALDDDALKVSVTEIYDGAQTAVENITDVNSFKSTYRSILEQARAYAGNAIADKILELKSNIVETINGKVDAIDALIDDDDLVDDLKDEIKDLLDELNSVTTLAQLADVKDELIESAESIITSYANTYLNTLITGFTSTLNDYYTELNGYITDNTLKEMVDEFVDTYTEKINAISSLTEAKNFKDNDLEDMEDDFLDIVEYIVYKAVSAANQIVFAARDIALEKIGTNEDALAILNDALDDYNDSVELISGLAGLEDAIEEAKTTAINGFKEAVAKKLEAARIQAAVLLAKISSCSDATTFSFIPDAMKHTYAENFASAASLAYDFTSFVNVSNINYGGFGEQWNMVIENLMEADHMLSVINKASTTINACCQLFTDYYSSKTCDDLNYSIETEDFEASVTFTSENLQMKFVIKLKNGVAIPLFGEVAPTIEYTVDDKQTEIFVKLSDTNKLRYEKKDDNSLLKVAIEYGITKGSRVSSVEFTKDGSKTTGELYEYVQLADHQLVPSCANIVIENGYVSVVGNKADGLKGMKGYINELYKADEGKLLGYEIRETLTFAGVSGTYNTLWFNLNDIDGITSVKLTEHTDGNGNDKNDNDVYINGSSVFFAPAWNAITVLGISKKTSRKYDIEFRTRYFYSQNSTTGEYEKHEVLIPMMFIQEDNDKDTNFTDYPTDVVAQNDYLTESYVKMNEDDLNKVLLDYDTLIDAFIENVEEAIESKDIAAYIDGE